ncbi:MAG: amidohydrolase [Chloroflexi bacterium]|nr:amidohydrolase [Chloroflexota bacterium]
MDTLILHGTIVTGDARRRIIADGGLAIQGERIVAVGKADEVRRQFPQLPAMDAQGKAVLPGFVNIHTHTVLTGLRGLVEDSDLAVVYTYMTPITFVMSADERSALAALGCLEAIRSGTTTLVDPLRHVATYAQAMADSGLRLFLSESCADALTLQIRHGSYEYSRAWGEEFLERAIALVETWHMRDGGRVQCHIAAHAPDNCSPWMLERLLELAQKYGLRRTVHLAQSQQEVVQVRKLHGGTPVEYLRDHRFLGPDLIAAHCLFCTPEDVTILAESGVHLAHCPASNSRRGWAGGAPMPLMLDSGVNVALGTDNMSEDMFEAMRIGIILNRGKRGNGVDPMPADMLDWATRNGARALGLEQDLGSLEPGQKADLVIVNLRRPHLVPTINLASNLVHYGQASDMETVMVDGKLVMKDGKVLTMSEEDVLRHAQEATLSAWRRLHQQYPDIPLPAGFPGAS